MELSSIVSSDITVTWNSTLVEFPETENIVFLSSLGRGPGQEGQSQVRYSSDTSKLKYLDVESCYKT